MANFMEQMYQERSPQNQARRASKERQIREKQNRSLANDVCDEVRNYIRIHWNAHLLEGYIGLYVFDGNNISFFKKLAKGNKNSVDAGKAYTYPGYLKMRSEEEADVFMGYIKNRLVEDGIKNFRIRKERITVESYKPLSLLKISQKEFDAYVFYIEVKW